MTTPRYDGDAESAALAAVGEGRLDELREQLRYVAAEHLAGREQQRDAAMRSTLAWLRKRCDPDLRDAMLVSALWLEANQEAAAHARRTDRELARLIRAEQTRGAAPVRASARVPNRLAEQVCPAPEEHRLEVEEYLREHHRPPLSKQGSECQACGRRLPGGAP